MHNFGAVSLSYPPPFRYSVILLFIMKKHSLTLRETLTLTPGVVQKCNNP